MVNDLRIKVKTEHQDICLSCGFCCDGTLFDKVSIELTEHFQFPIEGDKDNGFYFLQPCLAHEGSKCTIYDERPEACVAFRCKLLKNLEANRTGKEQSLFQISLTKSLIEDLDKKMLQHHPGLTGETYFHRFMNFSGHFKAQMSEANFEKKYGLVMRKFEIVQQSIKEHFYDGKR